ncbi:MAG TPA: FHA domain-containing protein [Bryobacteraceae bacterium]|nr:FHA domain-containing protein [Bryobacteraceae bacterium]
MADPSSIHQITGDDIISELLRNLDAGAFKIRYTSLVPCVFNVYLHPEDYDIIHPIADFIRTEAKLALADHLACLNKSPAGLSLTRWLGLDSENRHQYKILETDWSVEFHRDEEDRLRRGDLEIYSDLGSAQKAGLGAGAMTTFITRRPAGAPPNTDATRTTAERPVHAAIRYSDAAGQKTFPITHDQTVIGRGGKAVWVDLKVEGPADISREHCRIRRDPATGRFFIKDLSQYGTTVNGTAIPSSLERDASGAKADRNLEVALAERAVISLADVISLEFEANPPG